MSRSFDQKAKVNTFEPRKPIETLASKDVISLEGLQEQLSKEVDVPEESKLCALVIGHKKQSSGAANANSGITEFGFNEPLALKIEEKVQNTKIQRVYRRTFNELPGDINALGPDFIVSLHCNAFNTRASGTEVLYYHRSEKGKEMAKILLKHLVGHLQLRDRGIKPKSAEDRGGYLLRNTKAPCIIAEPFFIDNDSDLARAQEDMDGLVAAYANAIDEISQII